MLGILALIAVGIILLCMWGGEDELEDSMTAEDQAEFLLEPDAELSVRELLDELLQEDAALAEEDASPPEPATIEIGGSQPELEASEAAAIDDLIRDTAPPDIPLIPVQETITRDERPAPPPPRALTHVVQKGEVLSEISKKYCGTSRKWRDIQKANDGLNPRRLQVGMKLKIPPLAQVMSVGGVAAAASPPPALSVTGRAAPAAQRTYTVKKGDTLYDIARKVYGDGTRFKDIQAANRRLLSGHRYLQPGMTLVIP